MSTTEQAQGLGTGAGDFVVQQLHELQVDVLDDRHALEILRELCNKTLGADIRVEGYGGASPGESKFAAGQRQPFVSHWVVGDVAAIQPNRLSVEVVGQGLIGGRGIAERSRRETNTGGEVIGQLALESETNANANAVAVIAQCASAVLLEETLTAHPHIAGPAKTAEGLFEAGEALLLLLRGKRVIGQRGLHIGILRIELVDGILWGGLGRNRVRLLLGVRCSLLRLLQLLLRLLELLVGNLQLLIGLVQLL